MDINLPFLKLQILLHPQKLMPSTINETTVHHTCFKKIVSKFEMLLNNEFCYQFSTFPIHFRNITMINNFMSTEFFLRTLYKSITQMSNTCNTLGILSPCTSITLFHVISIRLLLLSLLLLQCC